MSIAEKLEIGPNVFFVTVGLYLLSNRRPGPTHPWVFASFAWQSWNNRLCQEVGMGRIYVVASFWHLWVAASFTW